MLAASAWGPKARAFDLGAGIAAAEEGDGRFRPATTLAYSPNQAYDGKFFYYGRTFGPVSESTGLLTVNQRAYPFGNPAIAIDLGIAILNETTKVVFNDEAYKDQSISESRWNGGLFTGFYWRIGTKSPFFVDFGWEAGIFPAGASGGLFLATGRKQFFSAQVGISL